MANIKELKKRIQSTKSTLKITTAMKLVSAAKLARAQSRIQGFRPYSTELERTVHVCAALAENYSHSYLKENSKNNKSIILIVSSDRGLCGGYNSQLFKKVKNFVASRPHEKFEFRFIGKKVRELMIRDSQENKGHKYTFSKIDPTFTEVKEVASDLAKLFDLDEMGKLYVAFNSFVSAISFEPTLSQVLPMTVSGDKKSEILKDFAMDFKYEPNSKEILDKLIPEVLNTTIYASILDAIASEHGSRMSAMDSASTNSKEMIRKLTLKTNKLRQAAITTELSEVVSGAESLNS